MTPAARAAIGFSVHTGWASAVVVARTGATASVVHKTRVELAGDEHDARFVFHVAGGWPIVGSGAARKPVAPDASARIITAATIESQQRAKSSLAAILADARAHGAVVKTAVFSPAKSHIDLDDLAPILASHAKVHAAETRLYTLALAHASAALGLAVASLAPKPPKLAKQPPPWGKDEKLAAALAWSGAISTTSA